MMLQSFQINYEDCFTQLGPAYQFLGILAKQEHRGPRSVDPECVAPPGFIDQVQIVFTAVATAMPNPMPAAISNRV